MKRILAISIISIVLISASLGLFFVSGQAAMANTCDSGSTCAPLSHCLDHCLGVVSTYTHPQIIAPILSLFVALTVAVGFMIIVELRSAKAVSSFKFSPVYLFATVELRE
ncbi:hypothetical protein IID19_03620 [Patescibacteria group bacterium]|nr:hypothetical protein [Patescibacteria group bacterium]